MITVTSISASLISIHRYDKILMQYVQGWHILRIKFKKSSPVDKIGENWRKLDKSGENWRKLILTIVGRCKRSSFQMDLIHMHY